MRIRGHPLFVWESRIHMGVIAFSEVQLRGCHRGEIRGHDMVTA
jgi:hypothetical protein